MIAHRPTRAGGSERVGPLRSLLTRDEALCLFVRSPEAVTLPHVRGALLGPDTRFGPALASLTVGTIDSMPLRSAFLGGDLERLEVCRVTTVSDHDPAGVHLLGVPVLVSLAEIRLAKLKGLPQHRGLIEVRNEVAKLLDRGIDLLVLCGLRALKWRPCRS